MAKCLFCKQDCRADQYTSNDGTLYNLFIYDCGICGPYCADNRLIHKLMKETIVPPAVINCISDNIKNKEMGNGIILWIYGDLTNQVKDINNVRDFRDYQSVQLEHNNKPQEILSLIAKKLNNKNPFSSISFSIRDLYKLKVADYDEMQIWLASLKNDGLIEFTPTLQMAETSPIKLFPKGWRYLEEHNKKVNKRQIFVAMNFDKDHEYIWETIASTIKQTKYYEPYRVDKTNFDNEKICEKIITEIKKSALLVADITGGKQGVYFEAGFAMGLNIPVIWTCKEDKKGDMHFDTRQYQHIIWSSPDDLAKSLNNKIQALYMPQEHII